MLKAGIFAVAYKAGKRENPRFMYPRVFRFSFFHPASYFTYVSLNFKGEREKITSTELFALVVYTRNN